MYSLQDVRDTLITAVESGIDYWSILTGYSNGEDGKPLFATIIEEGGKAHTIDKAVIRKGIRLIVNGKVALRKDLIAQVCTLHLDPVDADAADCIVQAGLFGEVVYG